MPAAGDVVVTDAPGCVFVCTFFFWYRSVWVCVRVCVHNCVRVSLSLSVHNCIRVWVCVCVYTIVYTSLTSALFSVGVVYGFVL